MTPEDLPPRVLAVLEAMTQPDPLPPAAFDSPAAAVRRRLPELTGIEAAETLCTLNALGLTKVPYVVGVASSAAATANLAKWITEDGWVALGVGSSSSTNRPGSDIERVE
jgi:hypothetical protein